MKKADLCLVIIIYRRIENETEKNGIPQLHINNRQSFPPDETLCNVSWLIDEIFILKPINTF